MNRPDSTSTSCPAPYADGRPVLEISDLCLDIARGQESIRLVDRVSFTMPRGRTIALLGESGCGKSLTALSILRLLPQPSVRQSGGAIRWIDASVGRAIDLGTLSERQMRGMRGRRISMIFQEPMTALNPVYTVGRQIIDVLRAHHSISNRKARATAVDWLRRVGLPAPERRAHEYPHQLSGGMRQRVLIAMALCCRPELLIADEPTTALDATVQMQILELLRNLQLRHGMSILFITHDLGAVASLADHVHVMYAGRIVESAPTAELLTGPLHPYTRGLLRCVPQCAKISEHVASGITSGRDEIVTTSGTNYDGWSHAPPGASSGAIEPAEAVVPTTRGAPGANHDADHPRNQSARSSMGEENDVRADAATTVDSSQENVLGSRRSLALPTIPGAVPEPAHYPTGCRFHPRCSLTYELAQTRESESVPLAHAAIPRALRRCVEDGQERHSGRPPLDEVAPRHDVACWEVPSTRDSSVPS
jgi:peptide/nickel transport system ATP-binding protein